MTTEFGNRTAEMDSTRVVLRGDAHGNIHILALQVLGGVAVDFGAPSIPLEHAQRRWPEHNNLWTSIRLTVGGLEAHAPEDPTPEKPIPFDPGEAPWPPLRRDVLDAMKDGKSHSALELCLTLGRARGKSAPL